MYPSADFAASGASWPFWVVLGWILACWELSGLEYGLLGWIWVLASWSLAFGGLLRLSLNSYCFLGLFVFCCTVVAYLPTNLFTLSAHLLINTVSCYAP